jgi:hypothetical protein
MIILMMFLSACSKVNDNIVSDTTEVGAKENVTNEIANNEKTDITGQKFSESSPLSMYYAIAELSDNEYEYLEQEFKWLSVYFNEVTMKEASTSNFIIPFVDWVRQNYGNLSDEEEQILAKEQNVLQELCLIIQFKIQNNEIALMQSNTAIESTNEKPIEISNTNFNDSAIDSSANNLTNSIDNNSLECHALVDYDDKQFVHIVTSTFPEENFYFDEGKELHVKIGSMIDGPSVIIYISDRIEPGKTYYMEGDTGFSFMNPDAMFNAGLSYSTMFGNANYDQHTIPDSLGDALESAELCVESWDRTTGIISGTIKLEDQFNKVYKASFNDSYLSLNHPARSDEYIEYLGNITQMESGQYIPDDFTLPDASELLPKEIPCHYCSNGKEECTMCVGGTTLQYKTDSYGGYGSYTEVACPKCGGVGWVRCSFCFGDGTILVLE